MLRFILAVLLIGALLKISQDNAYMGFGIYLFLFIVFMIYTIDTIDSDALDFQKNMSNSPKKSKIYYYALNTK